MGEYSSKDLADILKECSKYNLQSLKAGSLEVVFYEKDSSSKPSRRNKFSKDQSILANEASRVEGVREREMRLSQLDIEDPHAYEQMLINNSTAEFIDAQ